LLIRHSKYKNTLLQTAFGDFAYWVCSVSYGNTLSSKNSLFNISETKERGF